MNAEKFSPSPTGSIIVKRTFPGGMAVSNRSMTACIESTAFDSPGAVGLPQH